MCTAPIDFNRVDPFDGFHPLIKDASGIVYEKTGNTEDGRPVYCTFGNFRRACLSFGDELLYVLTSDNVIVPRAEYKPQGKQPLAP